MIGIPHISFIKLPVTKKYGKPPNAPLFLKSNVIPKY